MADSDSGGDAPVKRGRGRPKGTTKSGEPYVPKEKVPGRGRGRPKGAVAKTPKKPKVMKEFGVGGTPKKSFGRGRAQPKYDDFSSDEDIQEVQFVKMEKGRARPFVNNPFPRGKAAPSGKGRGRPPKKRAGEAESNGAPAAKKAKGKEEEPEEAEASEENGVEEDDSADQDE